MPATTNTKSTRFDHSTCGHATSGSEGKKARAACRKLHAKEAAETTTAKKPAPRKRATRKAPAKVAVASVPVEADALDDSDI